jgi:hypothetical protein
MLAIKNTNPTLTIFRTENRDNYRTGDYNSESIYNVEGQALSPSYDLVAEPIIRNARKPGPLQSINSIHSGRTLLTVGKN